MYHARKIGLIVLACCFFEKDIAAAEWALTGGLGQQLQYNDNISLSPFRKDSVVGYLLNPRFQASRKTGWVDLILDGQADIRRYSDSRWDCDNFKLGANSDYRTRRSVFSLSGAYGVSCSYAQQLTDTGLILPNTESETYQLNPSWTWQWTDRDQLIVGASYSKISYSNPQNGLALSNSNLLAFSGNDTYTVSVGENHKWSRRLTFNGALYYSHIQYTEPNASTQNLGGFQLGGNYRIDRFWTIDVNAGPVWVDTQPDSLNALSSAQGSSLSLGSNANIHLNYDGRITKFSTGYINAVNPSAIGQTLQSQSIFANYSYRLTRHLTVDLSGNYNLSESIGDESFDNSNGQFDRTYFTASAGITWDLTKHWQLRGSYAYSWQDYQQSQRLQNLEGIANLNVGSSEANMVMLFLNYSWDGVRISR
jgi:outer membrane receptor protein involved in Fe transport